MIDSPFNSKEYKKDISEILFDEMKVKKYLKIINKYQKGPFFIIHEFFNTFSIFNRNNHRIGSRVWTQYYLSYPRI